MKSTLCNFCNVKLNYFESTGFCYECGTYSLYNSKWNRPDSKSGSLQWIFSTKIMNSKSFNGKYVIEIHPLELFQNMISESYMQSHRVYSSNFNMKDERTEEIERIMDLASSFKMNRMVMYIAIRFLDIITYKINKYKDELNYSKRCFVKLEKDLTNSQTFISSNAVELNLKSKDRLISLKNSKLELIAVTCALIASKVHEIDDKIIRIFDIEKSMKYKYTFKNITHCEQKVCEELNWNLFIQTPYHYIDLFLSAGILFTDDVVRESSEILVKHSKDPSLSTSETNYFIDLNNSIRKSIENYALDASQEYEMLRYSDRVVGMACVCAARKSNKIFPIFSSHFERLYGIYYDDVEEAMEKLLNFSLKIPHLVRDSSYKSIPETPYRIKDIEYVVCEISDGMTYRDKKLFPKSINKRDKTNVNSPVFSIPKQQFSDYIELEEMKLTTNQTNIEINCAENQEYFQYKLNENAIQNQNLLNVIDKSNNYQDKGSKLKEKRTRLFRASSSANENKQSSPINKNLKGSKIIEKKIILTNNEDKHKHLNEAQKLIQLSLNNFQKFNSRSTFDFERKVKHRNHYSNIKAYNCKYSCKNIKANDSNQSNKTTAINSQWNVSRHSEVKGKANLRKQLIPKINKQLESFKTSKYEIIETKRTPSTTLNKFKQTWLNKDKNKCKSHLMKFKKVRNSDYLKKYQNNTKEKENNSKLDLRISLNFQTENLNIREKISTSREK